MSAWTRSSCCGRLVHVEIASPHIEATQPIALSLKEIMEEQAKGHPPFLSKRACTKLFIPLG